MSFVEGHWLWLAVPWWLGVGFCLRHQRSAFEWLERNVDPRFRSAFTGHRGASWRYHGWLLRVMGLLLIAAAAGPFLPGEGDELEVESPDVLLLIDASASMNAEDVKNLLLGQSEAPRSRFFAAKRLASALVDQMPNARFGLISYSGVATIQLPLTRDHGSVQEVLEALEIHNFYQSTGSNLRHVLEAVLPYALDRSSPLQVVLIGDGEIPGPRESKAEEDYGEIIDALARQEVAVHSVSIGSTAGENRLIFDFRDVVAGKEEKSVLRQFPTRRVDKHFSRISNATGGFFRPIDEDSVDENSVEDLVAAISDRGRSASSPSEDSKRDVTWVPVVGFLLLWLLERALPLARRPEPPNFELSAVGEEESVVGLRRSSGKNSSAAGPVIAALVLGLAGCGEQGLLDLAHRANEKGIDLDRSFRHGSALRQYEESRGFGLRTEVPTHNQARSLMLAERYAEAHELFQVALEIEPELVQALYNDGVNLFRWGVAERDPDDCHLERTLDLWQNARDRFASSLDASADKDLRASAGLNFSFVEKQIVEIERLIQNPPAACRSESSSEDSESEGGGGAEGDASQGGGQGEDEESSQGGGTGGSSNAEPESGEGDDSGQAAQAPPDPGQQDPPPEPPPGSPSEPQSEPQDGAGPGGGGSGGAQPEQQDAGLSPEQLEEIEGALARIAEQGNQDGHYHRRSEAEQFSKESWENPETELWW